jgi:AbrB family looped-hinge helix DNA binding protein
MIDGGIGMQTVTVSPKYQVVIPRKVRESLQLRPGQKMQVVEYEGRVELIPEKDITELRGFLKGRNTEFKREADSMILATAQKFGADIWTQDSDLEKIPGVKYYPKTACSQATN